MQAAKAGNFTRWQRRDAGSADWVVHMPVLACRPCAYSASCTSAVGFAEATSRAAHAPQGTPPAMQEQGSPLRWEMPAAAAAGKAATGGPACRPSRHRLAQLAASRRGQGGIGAGPDNRARPCCSPVPTQPLPAPTAPVCCCCSGQLQGGQRCFASCAACCAATPLLPPACPARNKGQAHGHGERPCLHTRSRLFEVKETPLPPFPHLVPT